MHFVFAGLRDILSMAHQLFTVSKIVCEVY